MKLLLFAPIILSIALISCSKKNTPTPKQTISTVNIAGKDYSTIVIGNQTWTTVNYDGPGGITDPSLDETVYGKFYTIAESEAITLPAGWRIPTQADFISLLKSQGVVQVTSGGRNELDSSASHLRSISNWSKNGDNHSGFNAEPAGFGYAANSSFLYQIGSAYYLSSTQYSAHANSNAVLVIEGAFIAGGIIDNKAYIDPYEFLINANLTLRFVKDN